MVKVHVHIRLSVSSLVTRMQAFFGGLSYFVLFFDPTIPPHAPVSHVFKF